jgi:uncharacterized 2Fe-2S/4Fe-4S cluster protein (DUF4445 family)
MHNYTMLDPNTKRVTVDFEPLGRRTQLQLGCTVLEAARNAGVELVSICGGQGTCDGCRIRLVSGVLSSPTEEEKAHFSPDELEEGYRLGCQAKPQGDIKVDCPPESLATTQRLQVEGQGVVGDCGGIMRGVDLVIDAASLTDLRSDTARLRDALGDVGCGEVTFSPEVLETVSEVLRQNDWRVRVALRENRVIAIFPEGTALAGLAVDVGTTKLAGYLMDLETGSTLAMTGAMNPQVAYGEDVISRIGYSNEHQDGRQTLQSKLVNTLNGMIEQMCAEAGVNRAQVTEAVVVGNTAMHHLLAGLPVRQLAMAPYVPAVGEASDFRASDLGLAIAPGALVHFPPNLAGFVGADHMSMVLSTDVWKASHTVMALDIGTNTEITLAIGGRMLSCSCASGPAFEGAHIEDGMRAAPGAIERVLISNGKPQTYTIGDRAPVGICGSGILAAVSEILKAGIIDYRGAFEEDAFNVRQSERTHQPEFVLVPSESTGHGRDIVVTRSDVNEIQLAKGAIWAGMEILLEEARIGYEAIDEFIVGGAFGTYLDVASAIAVGMFPDLPRHRFRQVGNAAGRGARQMLVSAERRLVADHIPDRIEYIELTTHPGFEKAFIEALYFQPFSKGERG